MKYIKKALIAFQKSFDSRIKMWKLVFITLFIALTTACSDFVEVDLPKQLLTSETVFDNPSTTEAVLKNIYANMRGGSPAATTVTFLMGLYADELNFYGNSPQFLSFRNHTLTPNDAQVLSWWGLSYNLIYEANALIENVTASTTLTPEDRDQFLGEGYFIRGYLYFMLVDIYGDVPYITTTDYTINTTVSRTPRDLIYDLIIEDLKWAKDLLPAEDFSEGGEKTRPYAAVANALLARAYLYNEDWAKAEETATNVIDAFTGLEPDLDKVFLKESTETIWQFKFNEGGSTGEASNFILELPPNIVGGMALTSEQVAAFEPGDLRLDHWTGEVPSFTTPESWRYAFKYKNLENISVEYPIQFRLAEQYLIRAEARAQQVDIPAAQQDINTIRNRAGLGDTTASSFNELLDAILQERRVELFTEHGHRWFDLKRMGRAKNVLSPIKPNWEDTNILLPIPESELLLNPNLLPQNDGY